MQGLKGDSHRSRMYGCLHCLEIGDLSWTFTTIKRKISDAACPLEPSLPPWSIKESQNLLHLRTATGNSYFYLSYYFVKLAENLFFKNPNSKWLFLTMFWYTRSLWFFVKIFRTLFSKKKSIFYSIIRLHHYNIYYYFILKYQFIQFSIHLSLLLTLKNLITCHIYYLFCIYLYIFHSY